MKKLTLLFAMVLMSLRCIAGGYRGMFEIGAGPGFGNGKIHTSTGVYEQKNTTFGWMLSTSHGCQFTPYLFAGAGFGVTYEGTKALAEGAVYGPESAPLRNHLLSIPIYLDIRWDLDINRKITPFAGIRLGYLISTEGFAGYGAESVQNSETHIAGLMRSFDSMYIQASAGARFKVGNNMGLNVGVSYVPILKREVIIESSQLINRGMLLLNVGIDFQGAGKSTTKEDRKQKLYRLQQKRLKKQSEKFDIQ